MKAGLDVDVIAQLKLSRAILLYENNNKREGMPDAFATLHDVRQGKIEDGKPLDLHALKLILEQKATKTPAPASAFIPEGVLAMGNENLIWWKAAHISPILFKGDVKELKAISGRKVPHPSLVFVSGKRALECLTVYAVKGDARPTLETELFEPPYWNIHGSRDVCLPSGYAIPKDLSPSSIESWERIFFCSHFSHSGGGGGSSFPGGHNALWPYLAKRRSDRFPDWCLKPTELKLKDIIDGKRR